MIKEKQSVVELAEIIHRMAINNIRFSEEISRVVLKCLNETMSKSEDARTAMYVVRKVIEINDELKHKRMEFLIGYGHTENPRVLGSIDQ